MVVSIWSVSFNFIQQDFDWIDNDQVTVNHVRKFAIKYYQYSGHERE